MPHIEDAYQALANELEVGGAAYRMGIEENQVVTDMYSLWHVRCCWKNLYIEDQELKGILAPSEDYSEDQRELLERHHFWTCEYEKCSTNVSIPGHHIAGFLLQRDWGRVRNALRGCQWRILESNSGEFIVTDSSRAGLVMPVTPTVCLVVTEGNSELELRQVNALMKRRSEQYYFGRLL